jgi:hypothetical protein
MSAVFAFEACEQLGKGNVPIPALKAFNGNGRAASAAAPAAKFQKAFRPIGEMVIRKKSRRVHDGFAC